MITIETRIARINADIERHSAEFDQIAARHRRAFGPVPSRWCGDCRAEVALTRDEFGILCCPNRHRFE